MLLRVFRLTPQQKQTVSAWKFMLLNTPVQTHKSTERFSLAHFCSKFSRGPTEGPLQSDAFPAAALVCPLVLVEWQYFFLCVCVHVCSCVFAAD